MKYASIALAGALWGSLFSNTVFAQPILNRVEQFLRDQIGNVRNPAGAQTSRSAEPGYLGLTADDRQDNGRALRIAEVAPGGPAAKAGLQNGDLIVSIGGQPIRSMDDMGRAVQGQPEGTKLIIVVKRGGIDRQQEVTLGRRPPAQPTGPISEELPEPKAPLGGTSVNGAPVRGAAANGAPSPAQGPRLGVRTLNVTDEVRQKNNLPDGNGAVVVGVTEGSPAAQAGIPMGAVIVAFNDKPVNTPQDLAAAVRDAGIRVVEVAYVHEGQAARKNVSLAGPLAPSVGPKLEVRARPIENPPKPQPTEGPALTESTDARTAALEARIRELEERIAKLEAARAGDSK